MAINQTISRRIDKSPSELKSDANDALFVAKNIENQRLNDGWKWLSNGKQTKLVRPDKIEYFKYKGFRLIK